MNTRMKWTGINTALTIMLIILFSACSKKVTFLNSAVVPAAEGTVNMKMDKNKNYNIDLSVRHLADPSRLTPSKTVYVVWMETTEGAKNIGQLKTSTRGLSRMLSSSLTTVTSHKQPTGFMITAEDDAVGNYPGTTVVLRTATIDNK